jgi:hypothetical protein
MAMGQDLVRVILFSPVSNIPSILHSHLHLFVALTCGIKVAMPGSLSNNSVISENNISCKSVFTGRQKYIKKLRGVTRVRLFAL